jgi:hypothetical protein
MRLAHSSRLVIVVRLGGYRDRLKLPEQRGSK